MLVGPCTVASALVSTRFRIDVETPRDARSDEYATIAELQIESWRSAYRGILPDRYLDHDILAERRAFWRHAARVRSPGLMVLVIDAGGSLAGFVSVARGADPGFDATIQNLHVRPQLRGRGLGRRLLAGVTERLLATAATSVCLWVYDCNHGALRFYHRLGAVVDARGYDDLAGANAAHTRLVWRDLGRLLAACGDA